MVCRGMHLLRQHLLQGLLMAAVTISSRLPKNIDLSWDRERNLVLAGTRGGEERTSHPNQPVMQMSIFQLDGLYLTNTSSYTLESTVPPWNDSTLVLCRR